ncbi:MAG: SusC/RagA family TonB-linked outer membrane protein [Saprospirales bacterium]|nr:SusC/RagA family TonB-linked outer membrane protein [Saprospirales bacterium]
MLFGINTISAQISGTIIDDTGEPLIGVNISLKNNITTGTITDIDGQYSIKAKPGDTLSYSYVGFQPLDRIVGDNKTINVTLGESSELLNEVVVIGYGTLTKKDLTGTVTKIGTKDFNKGSIATPEALLNGKVAGLQITTGGEPGSGSSINLRGQTSLSASSRPLFVVDGVPLEDNGVAGGRNPLSFINAADIESMTVLKDASAAAIYGSRGASGVIIITTKGGKAGKTKISYNGNMSTSLFSGDSGFLSPNNFRNAIIAKAPQEFEFLGDLNTEWVDEITQNPISTEHTLSVSGGTEKLTYNISAGFLNANGIIKTSQHQKKSLAGSIVTNLFNDNLRVKVNTRTSFMDDTFAPNTYGAALSFDPTRTVLDPDSEFGGFYEWNDALATNNPVATIDLTDNKGNSIRTLNSLELTYQLPWLDGLSITSRGSVDYQSGSSRLFIDPLLRSNFVNGGRLSNAETTNISKQIETYATYTKDLSSIKSKLTFTAGHSYLDTERDQDVDFGNGLEMVDGEYQYTTDIGKDSFLVINKLASFFGRLNYTYDEKYLLSASLRRDGSSRFGPNNRWGTFSSFAFGWRILQEDWASGLSNTFDNLKLRVGYGVTGNERFGDYLYNTFYFYGTPDAAYQFGDQFVPTLRGTGVDPDVKWEETSSINFGLDFGLLDNRLSGSIDVYQKFTDDLLFNAAPSAFTNISDRITTNIGEMTNKGIELSLNTVMIDGDSWDWDMGFNFTYNNNEITKLDNTSDSIFIAYETGGISGDVGQTIQVLQQGEVFNAFRSYEHILDANGNPLNDTGDHNDDGIPNNLDIYVDQNGDGVINEDDLILNGNPNPKYILGITNNLRWNNWDLSATLRSNIGMNIYNNVASAAGFYDRLDDRKTNNIHESAFVNDFTNRQLKSSVYISDGSFLKLDNVTLSYSLRDAGVFSSLRFYTTASNLLTITGYEGIDPEVAGGIDNNQYPRSRTFLMGISANF